MLDLKQRRKELGLTMLEVAKIVGVSEATISRYESGHILHMGEDKIKRYAKALQVPPSSFVDDDDYNEKCAPVTTDESALLAHLRQTYSDDDIDILSSLNRNQAVAIVEQAKKLKEE